MKKRVQDLLNEGVAAVCPVVLAELWMVARSEKNRSDVQKPQDVLLCHEMNVHARSPMRRRADKAVLNLRTGKYRIFPRSCSGGLQKEQKITP